MHRVELPISYTIAVCVMACWIGGVLVVVACNFWVEYDKINTDQKQSNWLREKCQDEDFVQNIRIHSDLCDNVNARDVELFALTLHQCYHCYCYYFLIVIVTINIKFH